MRPSRLLVLVSLVVFVEALFYSAVAPLLPGYSATLHLSKGQAGVLVGAYTFGSFFAALPGGIFASRVGAKPTLLSGLVIIGCSSILFGFARSAWQLDAARLGQGVGAALAWIGALAWLVALTDRRRRGELLGRALAVAAAGGIAGPAIGSAAASAGTRPVFTAVGAATLTLTFVAAVMQGPPRGQRQRTRRLVVAVAQRRLAGGLWLMALPSIMVGLIGVLGPLRLSKLGLSSVSIGLVFVIAAGFESWATAFAGRWADRAGRRPPLIVSLTAAALVFTLLSVADNKLVVTGLLVLAAVAYGACFAPTTALFTDEVESLGIDIAFGFALLMASWAPGQLLGSAGGGALATATSDAASYLALAALCLLTAVTLAVTRLGGEAPLVAPAATTSRAESDQGTMPPRSA